MRRTQESGETAILHTVFSTRRPCQRPRLNHSESARVAARIATPRSHHGESLPSAASAPATTIAGTAGTGRPACSTSTFTNTNQMPYLAISAPRSIALSFDLSDRRAHDPRDHLARRHPRPLRRGQEAGVRGEAGIGV